jgi:uncharacterized protein (TIGR02271 family)
VSRPGTHLPENNPVPPRKESSMTTPPQWDRLIGMTAADREGSKIGNVGQVYLDDATGQPEWVTVSTGLFGHRESFAPLYGSEIRGDRLVLAVPKELVQDAPTLDDDGHLAESETSALYQHYAGILNAAGDSGQERAGQSSGAADDAMTRSEEQLRVGTERVEAGRARLRKYVVTEQVTTTVPVSHEEVRLEREPITDANRDPALSGADITEQEHEVTLHAERPVVEKEAVPVERVRLSTETVGGEEEVSEQVRKEQIAEPELDADPGAADR